MLELPTRALVLEFNCCRLAAGAKPVVHCKAKHNHKEAQKAKSDDADGLEKEILLAEGAKVMLTRNLRTSKGLVNGAQGIVKKNQGSNPRSHLPAVVFVKLESYSGPETQGWTGLDPTWVPIVPSMHTGKTNLARL